MSIHGEPVLKDLANKVREYLRDGTCHLHLNEITDLGIHLSANESWHNQLQGMSDDDLRLILRGEIMHYSALDHLDKVTTTLSQQIVEKGDIVFNRLTSGKLLSEDSDPNPGLIKHVLAFLISYGNELYRCDNLDRSLLVCQEIYNRVKKYHSPDRPMYGMIARACVQLAKSFRQKVDYDIAGALYAEALEATHLQAEIKAAELVDDPVRLSKELSYYQRRSILILAAGSGYINIASGKFNRAAMIMWSLRTAILQDQDVLSRTLIKMLTASINRAKMWSDRETLANACKDLIEAYETFRDLDHVRYMRPTLFELVQGLIHLHRWEEAEKYTEELAGLNRKSYRSTNDPRWEIIATLMTGIRYKHQKRYDLALKYAERAVINKSAGSQQTRSRIEAAVLSGEALYHLNDLERATAKFREVRKLHDDVALKHRRVLPDQHLLVAADIYQARIALRQNNDELAQELYESARSQNIEHGWVIELLEELKNEMNSHGSKFIISDFQRPYKDIERELQDWLVIKLVNLLGQNAKLIAEVLKENRHTVGQWIHRSLGQQSRKRRRSRRKKKDRSHLDSDGTGKKGQT
ncbi:MAG: hypothetical protein IPM66_24900 [Acidobacteriota bacterium]|nr:MAG: hypothetical protein IPM66_24900 [Acidobacteriota bacterium]